MFSMSRNPRKFSSESRKNVEKSKVADNVYFHNNEAEENLRVPILFKVVLKLFIGFSYAAN